RLLPARRRTEKEPRGEPDGAGGRRGEVREISQRPQVAVPSFLRDQRVERRLAGHESRAAALDTVTHSRRRRVERVPVFVAREKDAAFFPQPAGCGGPERQGRGAAG